MRSLFLLPLLAACGTQTSDGEVIGPFSGPVQRYSIDHFTFPANNTQARDMGVDLDGDNHVDNQIGQILGTLAQQNDVTKYGDSMIQAGVLDSWIEVQANDPRNDDHVGVRLVGAPGTAFTVMGGTLVDGAFTSNPVATAKHPGAAALDLPVFADADPAHCEANALEMTFAPDGHGGLDGHLAGVIVRDTINVAIVRGFLQMMAANPRDHVYLLDIFDANHDEVVTMNEILQNSIIQSLTAPDQDGDHPGLSFGFNLHLVPCADGTCAASVMDPCFDRLRDGDETDVDCGGSCGKCAAALVCGSGADCQSGHCNSNGTCAEPRCDDGVKDGFESDIDCGIGCHGCLKDKACDFDGDCASGLCANGACTQPVQ